MRNISSFFYGVGQGVKNIFRNRMFSLASIGTMSACLFLFGVFYIVLSNFQYIVKSAETNVGITVFFDDGISEDRIEQIRADISKRAEVYRVEYVSADEAWEEYKATKLSPELAETFGNDNPLENSSSLTVFLSDVSMQAVLERYIRGIDGVRKLNDSAGVADTLAGINKAITVVSAVIIVVLLFVAAFLIGMTVSTGVSVRKREISIMKLIGASNYFIRIPYVVEGILIGLVGAVIPLVILHLAYKSTTDALASKFSTMLNSVSFLQMSDIMKVLIPVSLLIGVGIGYIGSSLTLNKQLKKIEEV